MESFTEVLLKDNTDAAYKEMTEADLILRMDEIREEIKQLQKGRVKLECSGRRSEVRMRSLLQDYDEQIKYWRGRMGVICNILFPHEPRKLLE